MGSEGCVRALAEMALTVVPSPVKRLQNCFGMRLGDAQQGTGCSDGAAVVLLPILEGAAADDDEVNFHSSRDLTRRDSNFESEM
jgi:hypothetical protein